MNILVIEDEKHNADRLIRLLEDTVEDARMDLWQVLLKHAISFGKPLQ